MGIRVVLHHKTIYNYDRLVALSPQIVRLRPAPHSRTPVTSYSLRIEPKDHFINWQQDPHGNFLARLVFPNPTWHFSLEVSLAADMTVINPFDFFLEPYAEKYPFRYESLEERDLEPFLEPSPLGPLLERFISSIDRREVRVIDFLVHLNQRLQREIRYTIRMEPGTQTPEETLRLASGSCRDTGWLLVQILRRLGLAARFVSGYLIQLKPDVKPLEGPAGANEDFTDLHAWAEVYLPGAGWIGLDPTSGLFAGEGHIPLAATPEPQSAAPVSGLVSECEVDFLHEMNVTRNQEDPRVTTRALRSRTANNNGTTYVKSPTKLMTSLPPVMCASRWVASRRLSPSTTWMAKNGIQPLLVRQSFGWPETLLSACAPASRLGAFFILARVSGIRASHCRVGHSVVIGGPTDCRCGTIRSG